MTARPKVCSSAKGGLVSLVVTHLESADSKLLTACRVLCSSCTLGVMMGNGIDWLQVCIISVQSAKCLCGYSYSLSVKLQMKCMRHVRVQRPAVLVTVVAEICYPWLFDSLALRCKFRIQAVLILRIITPDWLSESLVCRC